MSEALYEQRPLGDAVERHIGGGTPPRQVPSYWKGDIPWASVKDFPEQKGVIQDTEEHISSAGLHASASNLIPEQTPLVCTRMAVGRAALPVIPMAINQDVKALFPASGVSAGYLLKLMQYIQPLAEGRAVGSTVKGIRIQDYLNITVPMAPQKAQPVIAQVLDTLDTTIRETEVLIDKLKALKQGLLHDLLTRGIDVNGQLRPPQSEAPQLYKESPLGWIPREWEVVDVREAGEVKLGRQRSPNHERGQHMRPYFRVANVYDGFIDFSDVQEMNFSPSEQKVYSVLPGDILLNEGQSLELVGRCALYEGEPGIYCFQNTLVRFRANDATVPKYARQVFKYWLDNGRFTQVAKQTTSIAHLGADRFAVMPFPSPSRCEQVLIAERLQALTGREATERLQLQKLRQQKNGLMDDLLTGRVRVTPLLAPGGVA